MLRLAFDEIDGPAQFRSNGSGQINNLKSVANRRQRISQFMSQRRQKLVLTAIGLVQRIFQTFALGYIRRNADDAVWPPTAIEQRRSDRGINMQSIVLQNG